MKLEEIQKIMASTFQQVAIDEIAVTLENFFTNDKRYMQPYYLTGPAGLGKGYIIDCIVQVVEKAGAKICRMPVGATKAQLVAKFIAHSDMETLFIIDEEHAMKDGARQCLKEFTETGNSLRKTYFYPVNGEDVEIIADSRKWMFVAASNEAENDSALIGQGGRFKSLALMPYDEKGKTKVMALFQKVYSVELPKEGTEAFSMLVANVRPFGRAIKTLVNDMYIYSRVKKEKVTTLDAVKRALANRGYFPGGWTKDHVGILRYLATTPKGSQVKEITGAIPTLTSDDMTQSMLGELLQVQYVRTSQGKKVATIKGCEFLKSLDEKAKQSKAKATK